MQTAEQKRAAVERVTKWVAENRERRREYCIAYRAANKEKLRRADAEYRAKNRERHSSRATEWNRNNPGKRKEINRRYAENNPEVVAAKRERHRKEGKTTAWQRRYAVNNRDKLNAKDAARRAAELQASPAWLTSLQKEQILNWYEIAKERHVDHIVPLRGRTVCGLHLPWNLQLLAADANRSKGNRLPPPNQLVDYSARGYIGTEFEPEKLIPRKAA